MCLGVILHDETNRTTTSCSDADDGFYGALRTMLDMHENRSTTWP